MAAQCRPLQPVQGDPTDQALVSDRSQCLWSFCDSQNTRRSLWSFCAPSQLSVCVPHRGAAPLPQPLQIPRKTTATALGSLFLPKLHLSAARNPCWMYEGGRMDLNRQEPGWVLEFTLKSAG